MRVYKEATNWITMIPVGYGYDGEKFFYARQEDGPVRDDYCGIPSNDGLRPNFRSAGIVNLGDCPAEEVPTATRKALLAAYDEAQDEK